MNQKSGTDGYYSPHKIQKIAEDLRLDLKRVMNVIDFITSAAVTGRLPLYWPGLPNSDNKKIVTMATFQNPQAFNTAAEVYDKHHDAPAPSAFEVIEDL